MPSPNQPHAAGLDTLPCLRMDKGGHCHGSSNVDVAASMPCHADTTTLRVCSHSYQLRTKSTMLLHCELVLQHLQYALCCSHLPIPPSFVIIKIR